MLPGRGKTLPQHFLVVGFSYTYFLCLEKRNAQIFGMIKQIKTKIEYLNI